MKNLAKGIIASGNEYVPDLVGLCEVENDSCLYDLTRRSPLKEAGYRYVMTDSPDQRGIDVALLYQRGSFKLIQQLKRLRKMKETVFQDYEAPQVEIVEVEVERGFEASAQWFGPEKNWDE